MFMVTERLFLRPLWPEDAKTVHEGLANPAVHRNLASTRSPFPLEDAEQKIAADWAAWPQKISLGIFLRTDTGPHHVGHIGFGKRPDRDRAIELGYWIAEPYWGRGIAVEAGRAVLEHAFTAWRLPTLSAGHYTDNPNSGRVLQKLGFRKLPILRRYFSIPRGEDVICVEYLLTRDEWAGERMALAA
jgi:RimJ/RimL family protein N-acetyltransferase|tara:strand:+ start:11015 stop:11575 length:561 start_codon:yes stop_codon:yes gene_type:complete